MKIQFSDVSQVRTWLSSNLDFALVDVREHGEYGGGHSFFAVSIPYSMLEIDIYRLLPRKAVKLVVYDDGRSGVAELFATKAMELGYTDVSVMRGGTKAWQEAGHGLFAGVHVLSKTFGELVQETFDVPTVTADELAAIRSSSEDIVVLDGRPLSEYRKMNIPGSICCPNGELAYRFESLVKSPKTTIVVNCAGRTRSIIGAQTLRVIGVENPVYALSDGTMGWLLSGRQLENGSTRKYPEIGAVDLNTRRHTAAKIASADGISVLSAEELCAFQAQNARHTCYFLDVRTDEEFADGHFAGTVHAPGGQLIQGTDLWVAVRNSRVVLIDSDGIRSVVVAQWLKKMGYHVAVHANRTGDWDYFTAGQSSSAASSLREVTHTDFEDVAEDVRRGVRVIDIRPSMSFRRSRIAGSVWATRRNISRLLGDGALKVTLVASDPESARIVASDLRAHGVVDVRCHLLDAERDVAKLEVCGNIPSDEECVDFLFFVHDRHDGNLESAKNYLAWEHGLIASLDSEEARFHRLYVDAVEGPSSHHDQKREAHV